MSEKIYPWLGLSESDGVPKPERKEKENSSLDAAEGNNDRMRESETVVQSQLGSALSIHTPRTLPSEPRNEKPVAANEPISVQSAPPIDGSTDTRNSVPEHSVESTPMSYQQKPVQFENEPDTAHQRLKIQETEARQTYAPPIRNRAQTPGTAPTATPVEFTVTRTILHDGLNIVKNNMLPWVLSVYISTLVFALLLAPIFYFFNRDLLNSSYLLFAGAGSVVGFILQNLFYYVLITFLMGVLGTCLMALIIRGQLHELSGRKITIESFFLFDTELKKALKTLLPVNLSLILVGLIFPPIMLLSWFLGFTAQFGVTQNLTFIEAAKASGRLTTRNTGFVGLIFLLIGLPFGVILTVISLGGSTFFYIITAVILPVYMFAYCAGFTSLYLKIEHGDLGMKA